MKPEDLSTECGRCNGVGRIVEQTGNQFMSHRTEGTCPECLGRGLLLTSLGKVLIEFFDKARAHGLIR